MNFFSDFLASYPTYQLITLGILIIVFLIQIAYWFHYARVSVHKIAKHHTDDQHQDAPQGVSVILVIQNQCDFPEHTLPLLMAQQHPRFEVVVVNDCGGVDIDNMLSEQTLLYPNLRYTTIKKDGRFKHSRKVSLLVGIKAAQYERMVFTDPSFRPASDQWLGIMSRGFDTAELVIGYSSASDETQRGLLQRWIRAASMTRGFRYLSAAIDGHPYRGTFANIGYTKRLFFTHRGFTHLNMTRGEDDLFVQKVAPHAEVNAVFNPKCRTIAHYTPQSFKAWIEQSKLETAPYKLYPARERMTTFIELFSRFVFFAAALLLAVTAMPSWVAYLAIVLLLLREVCMGRAVRRIARRLGEQKIAGFYLLYDLLSPITEFVLFLMRRMTNVSGLYVARVK